MMGFMKRTRIAMKQEVVFSQLSFLQKEFLHGRQEISDLSMWHEKLDEAEALIDSYLAEELFRQYQLCFEAYKQSLTEKGDEKNE